MVERSAAPAAPSAGWRTFQHDSLAQLFDASFDDVYGYAQALTADHATAESIAEAAYERLLERLVEFEGSPAELAVYVLTLAGAAVRKLPRSTFQGHGIRESIARLAASEHEAITLRLVAREDAESISRATDHRLASILGAEVAALRSLRGGRAPVRASLPAANRQLDAALGRLLAGATPEEAAAAAPALEDSAALLAAAGSVAGLPVEAAAPEVRARVRNRFLAAAEARRAQWVHRHHAPAVVPGRRPRRKPRTVGTAASLVVAAILAVVAGAILAFAANFATPSSTIYPLKKLDESLLLALTLNRVDKANLEVQLSEERMREAETEAATHHGSTTVQSMRDRYDKLRAAAQDLGAVHNHDAHWRHVRDYYVSRASQPVDPLEHLLSSNGLKPYATDVSRLNEDFQAERKQLDAGLGTGGKVPGVVPSGAPNATPPPQQ